MAKLIEAHNIANGWSMVVSEILRKGKRVAPRGMETLEITNLTLYIEEGLYNIFENEVRDLNYRFMIAEWLWIQAGLEDVASLAQYNSVMRQFSDDGGILNGAYGPRLNSQWQYITKALRDEGSRQAVSTIWTTNPGLSKDIPCTISIQWLVREDKLHSTINMRSSDAWLGLPYDYFSFSQICNSLSCVIGLKVGSITMNLASSHLYQKDQKPAGQALQIPTQIYKSPQLRYHYELPSIEQVKAMLGQKGQPLNRPWHSYALALTSNKAHALEVLRALSKTD